MGDRRAIYALLGIVTVLAFGVIYGQIGNPDPAWSVIVGVVTLLVREVGGLSR